jgi:hypothetical protein
MDFFLAHMLDMLLALLAPGPLFFLSVLLSATIVLNSVTEAADGPCIALNFLSLTTGALLSWSFFPDSSPPLAYGTETVVALFSGMTAAALVNIAILRPA